MLFFPSLTLIASLASWYGVPYHGRITSSGERYNMYAMTAAHRSYPFGTKLRVCGCRCATVVVNDRGPFVGNRQIDLSLAAAKQTCIYSKGVGEVSITPIN